MIHKNCHGDKARRDREAFSVIESGIFIYLRVNGFGIALLVPYHQLNFVRKPTTHVGRRYQFARHCCVQTDSSLHLRQGTWNEQRDTRLQSVFAQEVTWTKDRFHLCFQWKVANHANQHLIRLIHRPGTIARVMVVQSPAKKTQRSVALHFLGQPHAMATNCNPPSGLCTNKWGEPTKITVLMQLRDQTCLICGNLWEMQMPTNSHPSTRRLTRLLPTMQCSYIQTRHTNGHR